MAEFNENKIVDILDTMNMLIEYGYFSLPTEVEAQIEENINEIHKLTEEIDKIFDNSY